MRKKLAAVLAVLALVAAMSIVPGQSALAQRGPPPREKCFQHLTPPVSFADIAAFVFCVLTGEEPPEPDVTKL